MNNEKIAVPSKEEVKTLLVFAMNDKNIHMETIGELLGMKLVDTLLPKFKNEPEWGYEGLRLFFNERGINGQNTFEEALEKLQ